ncbi:MAG: RidA family protein [Yoonia sp.]|nr:RidA family protein [Yoonia sp.]
MTDINRYHTGPRMSQIVTHGDTIYLAGQVGTAGASVTQQTKDCVANIDKLLSEVGSDKTRILQVTIWLANMDDFAQMNAVWDAWVPSGHTPARACGEAKLATPEYLVEFMVTAAMPS